MGQFFTIINRTGCRAGILHLKFMWDEADLGLTAPPRSRSRPNYIYIIYIYVLYI